MTRDALRSATLRDEEVLVRELAGLTGLGAGDRATISDRGADLVEKVRASGTVGIMEAFLAEYGLSTREGVALMCLAEAMLRVPDTLTVDELIRDKITPHDWASHIGDSGSILVNASTWGLMLTGRVMEDDGEGVAGTLHRLVRRMGEPVIRRAVGQAMAEMGSQFVLGRTIEEAMQRGDAMVAKGYTYSYDMLGEAARTDADAIGYFEAYQDAIAAIAGRAKDDDIRANPGISVKLSALHPRYEFGQRARMLPVMQERLLLLARAAKDAGIGFNIDAEEADRLDLSFDVIEPVLADQSLSGWDGFGVVVQAFGRRAVPALDWLYGLATSLDRRIMIRLVKGAYWDMEIKRAQVMGLESYPVFTRKAHTDVSYLACARKLLGMTDRIYPQFAIHNAHSVAAVLHMADGDRDAFEFQRLHGMGEALHDVVRASEGSRCRIYAPVGAHSDLLAYLVRRLLENGANSSFVNQIVDLSIDPMDISRDPVTVAEQHGFTPSPAIPRPADIFAPRRNSRGWDLTDPVDVQTIEVGRQQFAPPYRWSATPISPVDAMSGPAQEIINPARPSETVGTVANAGVDAVASVIEAAAAAQGGWAASGARARATILRKAAEIYEANSFEIFALASREAGKTLLDGVAEIREAADFLRYYADEAEKAGDASDARGVIVCISPWNFPLAIFTGQIAAALAAGNAVIAKPAEQTPLIAFRAVQWLMEAGVPEGVLQLLPGEGADVGAALTAHSGIAGVCFTGSTDVAKLIDRQLAKTAPDAMLIAETGGMNAMIVDSTALLEQATRDIVRAAFQSAGQRCSALRILYVQKDVEEDLLQMLSGAMDALVVGDPWDLATDVSPVIDHEALNGMRTYCAAAARSGKVAKSLAVPGDGLFVGPTMLRVNGIDDMEREIFGPILHVATFDGDGIDAVVKDINAKGFGLTFGLHTRIDRRVQHVLDHVHVGNAYVNRDQIGAVVGSQPFGGHGLSGTGPKAGGPNYLPRFRKPALVGKAEAQSPSQTVTAEAINSVRDTLDASAWRDAADRIQKLRSLLRGTAAGPVSEMAALDFGPVDLPGPAGESNQFLLEGRGTVLCLGPDNAAVRDQTVRALAAGNAVVAISPEAHAALKPLLGAGLPLAALSGRVVVADLRSLAFNVVAYDGEEVETHAIRRALADRDGPILPLIRSGDEPVLYCNEKTICIDTTAAGGNATLLSEAS